MIKTPKEPVGRALAEEAELDEAELDKVVGGTGALTGRQDQDDGWSKIVDDHAKEIPAKVPANQSHGSSRRSHGDRQD